MIVLRGKTGKPTRVQRGDVLVYNPDRKELWFQRGTTVLRVGPKNRTIEHEIVSNPTDSPNRFLMFAKVIADIAGLKVDHIVRMDGKVRAEFTSDS